jgi:murein DD-endopeptidase MepM/ murein hydrolase activator NlpD
VKRFLAFIAAAALGVTMMLPATAYAEQEAFEPAQSSGVQLTPQSLAAGPGDSAPVIRDGYTIEAPPPPPPPIASTGFTSTPIPGLLTTWPCSGAVNEGYGPRGEGFHYGADIICGMGTVAVATGPGVVLESEVGGSWGQYVKIDHGGGVATLCAHLIIGSQTVAVGQSVSAGDQIGLVGDSGNASVAHCHFEVWVNGNRVDPIPWLP